MATSARRTRPALVLPFLVLLAGPRPSLGAPDVRAMDQVEQRIRRVAEEALPRTVAIRVEREGRAIGFGSGAVVSGDGLVLTCAHVTEAGEGGRLVAVWADGTEAELEVLGGIARNDVSLARAKGLPGSRPSFVLADANPALGDWVVGLGHPGGPFPDGRPSVAAGKVTAIDRSFPIVLGGKEYVDAIQTDAPLYGGDSGGPLVDLDGRLVGINGAILLVGDAAVAYPAARVKPVLAALAAGERPAPRRIEDLGASMMALAQEVDPDQLLDIVADDTLRALLHAFGSRLRADPEAARRPMAPRRLDDLRAAYGTPAGAPVVVGLERGGVRAGYAVAWAPSGDDVLFVTAAHVLPEEGEVALDLTRGAGPARTPARVLGVDGEHGFALLAARRPAGGAWAALPAIRPAPDPAGTAGSFVFVLGADAANPVFQGGIVAARRRRVGTERRIPTLGIVRLFQPPHTSPFRPFPEILQIDAPIEADEAGAAVVRPDGGLLGLAVAHFHRGATMVVPTAVVAARIDALKAGKGTPTPPSYGVPPLPAPDRAALAERVAARQVRRWRVYVPTLSGVKRPATFEETEGRLVLAEDSGAGALDLKAGDVLVSVGGVATPTVAAAAAVVARLAAGASVAVVVRRDTADVAYDAEVTVDGTDRRVLLTSKR